MEILGIYNTFIFFIKVIMFFGPSNFFFKRQMGLWFLFFFYFKPFTFSEKIMVSNKNRKGCSWDSVDGGEEGRAFMRPY
jgi:hypothetical protein